VKVAESFSGVTADWDGGDGAGLGRFNGANHGGFQNAALTDTFDAPFLGSMAAVKLYSGVLTQAQIFQNYVAVDAVTDVDGDSITVTGALDPSDTLIALGTPFTAASGATVTILNSSGHFDYNHNGVFSLLPGEMILDTFGYRVTDGNGETADATVSVQITGVADVIDDNLTALDGETKVYFANALLANDEIVTAGATPGALMELVPTSASGGTWTDIGSRGTNATITGAIITPQDLESNFGLIGAGVTVANTLDFAANSAAPATIEVWFKPDAGQTGKRTIFETGGNGIGSSIVYDPAAGSVIATIDGGDDVNQKLQASATGVVTGEFNQVIVVFNINGGAEVGVASGIFEDIVDVYLNNDPMATFDGTVDGTATQTTGDVDGWSGTDDVGINRVTGTSAANENFAGMLGTVAAVRVYTSILTPLEMEANYDNFKATITSVSTPTTMEGAPVTLNADGSVTVDYSGITISPADVAMDGFTYTTALGTGNVDISIYSTLAAWRVENGLPADGSGSGTDTDGLSELFEFAFGTDPNVDDNNPLAVTDGTNFSPGTQIANITIPFNPTNVNAQFVRRKDAAAAGLTYIPEFSADLSTWEVDGSNPVPVVVSTMAGDYEVVEVPYLVFLSNGQKASFFRIRVNSTGSAETSP